MRRERPNWLIRVLGIAVIAVAATFPYAAQAQLRDARACATQTESLADERIAACGALLGNGRLRGKPLGVAYSFRGLAYLDRGDFAPAYQNRGNAWYARGNYGQAIADYDATIRIDPDSPSPYVNRATVRRDLGYVEGALADYQKAISLGANRSTPYSGRGQIYLRQHDYAHALNDFDRAVHLDPASGNYMLRGQAREGAGDLN